MGEPGTKELISLEDLQAAGGLRTGRKHVLSILVENKPGVLTRIDGLFARRAFNIESLTVGHTETDRISRMTVVVETDEYGARRLEAHLYKLVPVRRVEISNTARNHILNGLRVFSSTVPDVRLVWWPQSAHSNVVPLRIVHTRAEVHRAHAGSPPQRAWIQ